MEGRPWTEAQACTRKTATRGLPADCRTWECATLPSCDCCPEKDALADAPGVGGLVGMCILPRCYDGRRE